MFKRIEKKKERRKKFYMGSILAFLMIISMMGILLNNSSGSTQFKYNSFKFDLENNVLTTKINGEKKSFTSLPQELSNIKRPDNLKNILNKPYIYLTFNPDETLQNLRYLDLIRKDFSDSTNTIVQSSIINNSDSYQLPIITCENATINIPVLYFKSSNETTITMQDNCLILTSQNSDFLKLRDLLLYINYGVMNG